MTAASRRSRMLRNAGALPVVAASVLLASCGTPHTTSQSAANRAVERSSTTVTVPPTTLEPRATPTSRVTRAAVPVTIPPTSLPPTTLPPTTAPPTTTPPTAAPTTTAPPPPPDSDLLVNRLIGVDGADQVVAVVADGYGDTTATMTAYQRGADGWTQVFGPWQAEIGEAGFAPPGLKREGDLRTPSGSYGFGFFFGIEPNPGVSFSYRPVSYSDVWDDDPTSALYNQWVDEATQGVAAAGADPEPMYDPPFYDYGAVIDYNMDPVVPYDGSAIFFHVSNGSPTVGCVALPEDELLSVLEWLNPGDAPRIIMGTESTVVS